MYWKFKLPLIAVLLVALLALCYVTLRAFQAKTHTPQTAAATTAQPPASAPHEPTTASQTQTQTQPQPPEPATATPIQPPKTFTVDEIPDNAQKQPTPVTTEPAKPEPPKPEPVVAQPEPPKPEPVVAQPEPPKPEPVVAQPEPPQPEPAIANPEPPEPVVAKPEPVVAQTTPAEAEALLKQASELSQRQPLEARSLAHRALTLPGVQEYDATWRRAAQLISDINRVFMNSTAPCPEKRTYTVKAGDVLVRIAYREKTTVQALMKLNGNLDPRRLYVGRKLAYIGGDWSIKVSKSQFLLTLYLDGTLYRIYKVGIGRDNRTPVGTFKVRDKVINPAWDSPEGRIPPSDPRNILGTRWMGLEATGDTSPYLTGYGIHGTTLPDTVGTPSSAGCVRLRNEEVNDLYDVIPEPQANATHVTIVE
ncbi:MAG: L,D-transpeptidase family protein [Oligosphaeraceae bacterium]